MIKQVFLVLIATGIVSALTCAGGTTAAETGFTVNGICYYRNDPVCKTWTAAGCTECNTDAAATTPDATTGNCSCPTTGKRNLISTGVCVADGSDAAKITPYATRFVQGDAAVTHDKGCHVTCQVCDTAANDQKCTKCWGASATQTSGPCVAPTATPYLVVGQGYLATCPVGYFQNETTKQCDRCKVGCSKCAAANGCDECPEGFIKNATGVCTAVAANGADGGCGAQCGDKKCHTTKDKCTACAADHTLSAADTCVKTKVKQCKEYDTTDVNKCKTCVDNADAPATDGSCKCKSGYIAEFQAWAAKTGTATADTPYKNECRACTDAEKTTVDACKASAAPALSTVSVTCTDTALTGKQCATCGTDGKCTACINNSLKLADGGCDACADKYVRKSTTECAPVGDCKDTACTDNKKCGWNSTTSKVECVTLAAETTSAATNGLLLSAISMVAALILA